MNSVESPVTGSVWQINITVGDTVAQGDELVVLESMKMEIPVNSPVDGVVSEILIGLTDSVNKGDVVLMIDAK